MICSILTRRLLAIALVLFARSVSAQSFDMVQHGSDSDLGCSFAPQQIWNQGTPAIQFTLDLLVLDRSDSDSGQFLFDSQTLQPLSDNGNLIREAEPGVRMGLILFSECGRDIEFGFMQTDRFGHAQTFASPNPIIFPFFNGLPANPSNSYRVALESSFKSAEVNLRQRYGSRVALIAGLRYWELNEYFNITDDRGGFFSSTDNDLYGFQIGAEVEWLRVRRSVLFTSIKAGVYYNNADVSARASTGNAPLEFIDDEDEVAFAGDFSAGLLIPMGPQADFRIGYQGFLLDGVGLAPNQSNNYNIFTGSGSLDKSTVVYHGGFVGIDLFF